MLERIRTATERKDDQGFTLIELLVVMIIIGILAAIAIPVFLNQQVKARETSAKADVSTIGKEIAAYYVDGTGTLTVTSSAGTWTMDDAASVEVTRGNLSGDNTVSDNSAVTDGTDFCVAVYSEQDAGEDGADRSHAWSYTQNGLVKGDCPVIG